MNVCTLKIFIITLISCQLTIQICQNSSTAKYDLTSPAEITNYHSVCQKYVKRTCCSPKNLDTLIRKIKKTTQSINISHQCKTILSDTLCSACDGDWGQAKYDGICGSQCYRIYENCADDLFVVENNGNKLRPCREQDYFCWKLSDISSHYKLNFNSNKGRTQICTFFDLPGSEHEGDCWNGQVSALQQGRGKKKINYAKERKHKTQKIRFWIQYQKQLIYTSIVAFLVGVMCYKWCKPTCPRYYRLN